MNVLRRPRTQHAIGRRISHLILLVLALRLLLPTGLMLDMSTEGKRMGGPLVICSGHGPLVIPSLIGTSTPGFSIDGEVADTSESASALSGEMHTASTGTNPERSGGVTSNEICPFSAAFMKALIAFAVLLFFCHFSTRVVARYRRQSFGFLQQFFRTSHSPRGPPRFA
ncbi:hypothetical protein [Paraburkholderia antibiotica]|uniref:DUF2946 domain-containing protein n=1 Tax=Paraburkholderia antibiotica TaxID=2728839 RepID=A0A7X9X6U0_9BURK|nr:hypothetical protein [Paraburkholderia antibiotica]NML32579.1 hypothetical protein [Paraburkholderia antibiotica]